MDEMTELQQEVERLRADLRAALDGWRWALARADASTTKSPDARGYPDAESDRSLSAALQSR